MVSPKGLHVTTPDAALRRRAWEHIRDLIDLCADLGPDGVMVFRLPEQRATTGGLTRERPPATSSTAWPPSRRTPTARRHGAGGGAAAQQATWCRRCDEAAAIVRQIASPAIRTMFDVHNAVDETEPHAVLVDRYFDVIRHVHVNELDGRHCGTGNYDFRPVFEVLARRRYTGWVSLEAFDFTPGGERIANESLRHLEARSHNCPMSHYVVTGGAGFIGSAIVRRLLGEGARRVVVIDNLLTGSEANLEEVRGSIDFERADIRCYEEIAGVIRGAAVVFHEAAIPSVPRSIDDPVPSHEVNIDGTFNVLRAAREGRSGPRGLRRVLIGLRRYRSAAQSREHDAAARNRPTRCRNSWANITPVFASVYGLETVCAALFQRVRSAPGPRQPVLRRALALHEARAGA